VRWDIARASQKPRVLMLHGMCVCQDNVKGTSQQPAHRFILIGNVESGASFESKTRFIRNLLENACPSFPGGVELFYLTAPHRIQPASSITRAGKRVIPEEGDFDAWTWAFGDYMTEVMQGYGQTIRYMLEVIRTAGPFIGIVGFSAGATTAHTLVSLAERRASPELMQNFQIDSKVCSFYILTPA
jgi:Serine hydrolase (FSH1)